MTGRPTPRVEAAVRPYKPRSLRRRGEAGGTFLLCCSASSIPPRRGDVNGEFLQSKGLVLVRGDIGHDVLHVAVEDPAEVVDGGGVQGLVLAELVQGGAGDMVVFDEGVGGLGGCFQRLPEGGVDDHGGTSAVLFLSMVCGGLFLD